MSTPTKKPEKRRLAIVTIAQDEPEFFPKWLAHYTRHVPAEDIYVLHHLVPGVSRDTQWEPLGDLLRVAAETDGTSNPLRTDLTSVVTLDYPLAFDHRWLCATVARFQAFLCQVYDWVLFAEADELVQPDCGSLLAYAHILDANGQQSARCTGYEVVHKFDAEPALLRNMPWLRQRQFCYQSNLYSKVLMARGPMTWEPGFHNPEPNTLGSTRRPDPGLALVHLKKVDLDLARERTVRSAARKWSQTDVDAARGWQNRIEDEGALRRFFVNSMDTGQPANLVPIPEWLRDLA
jgi:hypothetical protein